MSKRWAGAIALVAVALGATLPAYASSSPCERACLERLLAQTLEALITHTPATLPLASAVRYTENDVAVPLGTGLWRTASALGTYHIVGVDSRAGQVGYLGVIRQGQSASMLALRLKVSAGEITEVEALVPGATLPAEFHDAPAKLVRARAAFAAPIDPPHRQSRAELVAAANSYYEGIEHGSGTGVAFAADCHRIENGVALVNNADFHFPLVSPQGHALPNFAAMGCREQFDSHLWETDSDTDRRYPLVDRAHGLVFAFTRYHAHAKGACANVPQVGAVCGTQDLPPFSLAMLEVFRIRDGLIHEMESVWSVLPRNDMHTVWPLDP